MTLPGTQAPPRGLLRLASRNAAAAVATRFSGVVVAMVLTPFVLRSLGPERYGLAVLVGSVAEYMFLLRGGIGGALRRYVTLHHQAGRSELAARYYASGFWWGTVVRAFLLVAGLALSWPLVRFFGLEDGVADAAVGVGLLFTAAVLADLFTTVSIPVYASGRTAPTALLQLVEGWARVAALLLALRFLGPRLSVYGAVVACLGLLLVVAQGQFARRTRVVPRVLPPPAFGDPEVRRELFRYGRLAVLAQVAALLYVSTDNVFIGRLFGPEQVTHYSLGTRWAPILLGFVTATLSGMTPIFTGMEARGEQGRSRRALLQVVAVTSSVAVPICLVPCVLGDLFLEQWVGPQYRGSYRYLVVMLIPAALEGALNPVWMALVARGRIGWVATADIVVAVGNVGLSLFLALVLQLGLLGFAIGNTAALLAKNLLLRPIMGRRDPSMPSMPEYLRPVGKAFVGALPGLVLLWLGRPWYGGSLAAIIAAGVAGGAIAVAGAALLAIGPTGLRRLRRLAPLGGGGGALRGGASLDREPRDGEPPSGEPRGD